MKFLSAISVPFMYLQTEKDFQSSQFSNSNSDVQILGVLSAGDLSACSQSWGMLSGKTAFTQHGSALNTVSTQQFTPENRGGGVCGRRITKRKYEGWWDKLTGQISLKTGQGGQILSWDGEERFGYIQKMVVFGQCHLAKNSCSTLARHRHARQRGFHEMRSLGELLLKKRQEGWEDCSMEKALSLPACVRTWVQNAHNSRTARLASSLLRTQKAETLSLGQSD